MQSYPFFFALEVLYSFYLLIALALIAEKYLMPSLMNISKRYKLSKDITGIVVAIGNLIPELATTILSFMQHGIKMTEFGVACNLGCASFSLTVVPAFAILINAYTSGEKDWFSIEKENEQEEYNVNNLEKIERSSQSEISVQLRHSHRSLEETQAREMMTPFIRDFVFYLASLIIFNIFLQDDVIYSSQLFTFAFFTVLYFLTIYYMNKFNHQKSLQQSKHEDLLYIESSSCHSHCKEDDEIEGEKLLNIEEEENYSNNFMKEKINT